jgi:uncharacterized protein YjiS (DUF1127 family)
MHGNTSIESGVPYAGRAGVSALAAGLSAIIDLLWTWRGRARERWALLGLDERMLKDVGLSRADVEGEAGKPFWRP